MTGAANGEPAAAIMSFLADNPVGQAAVSPFLAALVLTLLLRLILGAGRTRYLPVSGIGVGFLLAYALAVGIPALLPHASTQKIFYIVLIGLVLGIAIDAAGATRRAGHAVAFLLPAAALAWIAQRRFAGLTLEGWAILAALLVASVLVYWRLAASTRGRDEAGQTSVALAPAIMLLITGASLGALALIAASASLAQFAFALAAAAGGHLLVEYVAHVLGFRVGAFGAAGAFGAGGALLAIVYVMGLFTSGLSPISLLLVLCVYLAQAPARALALRVGSDATVLGRAVQPVLFGLVVAVPAVLAVLYVTLVLGDRPGG
jgi:hypothetical protein